MDKTNKIKFLSNIQKEDIFNTICNDIYGIKKCPFTFADISYKFENINDPQVFEDLIRKFFEEFNNSQNIQSYIDFSYYWSYFTADNIINAIIVVVVLIMLGCIIDAYLSDSTPPSSPPSSFSTQPPELSKPTIDLLTELSESEINQILESAINQPTELLESTINQPTKLSESEINQLTELLESVFSQPTKLLEPVINQSTELLESTVESTVEMPMSSEYFIGPVIGHIGPESIVGSDFQYSSLTDHLYLINFANRVNEMTDSAEQAELIELLQMCVNVQEMLQILLTYF